MNEHTKEALAKAHEAAHDLDQADNDEAVAVAAQTLTARCLHAFLSLIQEEAEADAK